MLKKIIIYLITLIFSSSIFCQIESPFFLDSISEIYKKTEDDYIKTKLEYSIAVHYFNNYQYDSALFYGKHVYKKSTAKKYDTLIGKSLVTIGAIFATKNEHDSLIKYLSKEKATAIKEETINYEQEAKMKSLLAYSYTMKGQYEKAFFNYEQSYIAHQKLGDTARMVFNLIGQIELLSRIYAYDKCLKLIDKVDVMDKKDIHKGDFLLKKASIYKEVYGSDSSIKYYRLTVNYLIKTRKHKAGLASAYDNLASIYGNIGQCDSAYMYFTKSSKIYEEIGLDNHRIITLLNEINFLIFCSKEFETAEGKIKTIDYVPDNFKYLYHALKGEIFKIKNNNERALANFKKALQYAESYNVIGVQKKMHGSLYSFYKKQNDFKNALHHNELIKKIQDSIFSQEKSLAIQKVLIEKLIKEKDYKLQAEILKHEKQLSMETKRFWVIFSISLGLLSLVVFFYQRNKLSKEKIIVTTTQNELLKSENLNAKSDLEKISFEWEKSKEFLRKTKNKLKEIQFSEEKHTKLNSLLAVTNQFITIEEQKINFQEKIKEIQDSFFFRLDELGKLTKTDKKLAALLSLNLTSREIASVLEVSEKSIETYRSRLRKKLNIPIDVDLNNYFKSI